MNSFISLFRRNRASTASAAPKPMVERLEDRKYMAAIANPSKMKLINASSNGISTNQSVITIPFSEELILADVSKIRVRGYVINTLGGGQVKKVINIVPGSARVVDGDKRYFQFTTDRLMRKGGKIYFDPGSLKNLADGQNIPTQVIQSTKGQNKERFTLANRAFKPTDLSFFNPTTYSGAPAPTTANSTVDQPTALAALTLLLDKKVAAGQITAAQKTTALTQFNGTAANTIVPDHNLRAALISLTGTIAEAAIPTILNGNNLSGKPYLKVEFATPRPSAIIADTDITLTGKLRIRVKPEFAGESFIALSAILAHETLHQDDGTGDNGVFEETIASAIETVVYAQQLDLDNSVANDGTTLVVDQNVKLLAMLNSGRQLFPIVGLQQGPNLNDDQGIFRDGIVPAGGAYASFEDFTKRGYIARGSPVTNSVGNDTLRVYIEHFNDAIPSSQFNQTVIDQLDRNLYPVLTNPMAVRLAKALKLST
jgi:hypothetical protein